MMYKTKTLFLQLALILIFYSACQAGYFNGQAYIDYAKSGSYTSDTDIENSLSWIGTLGSIVAVITCLFFRPTKNRSISGYFILAQILLFLLSITVIIAGNLSPAMIEKNLVSMVKVVLCALALTVIVRSISIGRAVFSIIALTWILCLVGDYISYTNPAFATSIGASGWRGLFETKNGYAAYCLYAAILITPGLLIKRLFVLTTVTFLLLIISLLLTQGKTAAIESTIYTIIISIAWLMRKFRMSNRRVVAGLTYSAVPILLASLLVIGVFTGVGVFTFSGRTALWEFYIRDLGDWYLFGKGGGAALTDPALLERAMDKGIRGGAIDSTPVVILYSYGLVGLLVWLVFIKKCFGRALSLSNNSIAIFVLGAIVSFTIHAFLESACQLILTMPTFTILLMILMLEKQDSDNLLAPQNLREDG